MLWILSFQPNAIKFFADFNHNLIEKVTKIMDYFSWEKIARCILQLYDNLKGVPEVQDHFSDIDALGQVNKLMNRHWIDEDINKMLERLLQYFEDNQMVFSSIDKLRN